MNNPVIFIDYSGTIASEDNFSAASLSQSDRNYYYNRRINITQDYIHDQGALPYRKFLMGSYTADHSGCPWVSVFNALLYLGIFIHPSEIIRYYEYNNGLILNG
jgi:hypothetical protein